MSKWCIECYRNQIYKVSRSCTRDCPAFGLHEDEAQKKLVEQEMEIDRLKYIIKSNAHSAELAIAAAQQFLVNARTETIDEFAERACDELRTGNIIMDKSIADAIYHIADKMKEQLK
jgi:hypothetical protein